MDGCLIALTEMPFIGGWVKLILFVAPPALIVYLIQKSVSFNDVLLMTLFLFFGSIWLIFLARVVGIKVVVPIIGLPWVWITTLGFFVSLCVSLGSL